MEGDNIIAVGGDLLEVPVPGLTRIEPKLLARLAEQHVPGALHVLGGERSAVMPLNTLAQPECESGSILTPRPATGEVRHDRFQTVLRLVLIVHHEIVKDAHHRHDCRVRRLLMDRHARRAVPVVDAEDPTLFLGECRIGTRHGDEQRARCRKQAKLSCHLPNVPLVWRGL